jgi:hypothetical protein
VPACGPHRGAAGAPGSSGEAIPVPPKVGPRGHTTATTLGTPYSRPERITECVGPTAQIALDREISRVRASLSVPVWKAEAAASSWALFISISVYDTTTAGLHVSGPAPSELQLQSEAGQSQRRHPDVPWAQFLGISPIVIISHISVISRGSGAQVPFVASGRGADGRCGGRSLAAFNGQTAQGSPEMDLHTNILSDRP